MMRANMSLGYQTFFADNRRKQTVRKTSEGKKIAIDFAANAYLLHFNGWCTVGGNDCVFVVTLFPHYSFVNYKLLPVNLFCILSAFNIGNLFLRREPNELKGIKDKCKSKCSYGMNNCFFTVCLCTYPFWGKVSNANWFSVMESFVCVVVVHACLMYFIFVHFLYQEIRIETYFSRISRKNK